MLFNSLQFLLFFPVVTLLYSVIPQRAKVYWLLAASYYFYMCWNARYALLLLFSTAVTYLSGILIAYGAKTTRMKKLWVALSFCANLSILFFFKYSNFVFDSLRQVFAALHIQLHLPVIDVLLPVGISFYIFQALSYTVDVYRGDVACEKNFARYALFVSFFPQLVAGPIERSGHLLTQIQNAPKPSYAGVKSGLLLMLWGFFEKMILADQAALVVDRIFAEYQSMNAVQILFGVLLFALQIYCDFGGYSHIAIGAAEVMGFSLMENFRQPYFAVSVQDFWRRWHVSLSTWFRDYLYIPLGGNRKGTARKYLNLMITFCVSGLWHGSAWTYVIWGGLNGAFQVAGGLTAPARRRIKQALRVKETGWIAGLWSRLVTFVLIDFAWLFFRAESLDQALFMLRRVLTEFSASQLQAASFLLRADETASVRWLCMMAAALLILFLADLWRERWGGARAWLLRQPWWLVSAVAIAGVCAVLVFGVYGDGYDAAQFVYFQF